MPKPSANSLIKEIKSEEIERVYINVTNKAVEWAVAGFIDEANLLLEKLWSFGTPHSGHLWVPDQGLLVMWQLSGKRPKQIPFAEQDIAAIEKLNFNGLFINGLLQSHLHTFTDVSLGLVTDVLLTAEKHLDIEKADDAIKAEINGYEKSLAAGAVGYDYFHSATCGAILAARLGDTAKAVQFILKWGEGYSENWSNYTLAYLMRDTATAKLLLTGILAPVFKLTKAICNKDYETIAAALDDRYSAGRGLAYGSLSWKQLLKRISELAIAQKSYDFSQQAITTKWLGESAATKRDIKAAEKRLGVCLPDDYRDFLLASNGFASISITDTTLAAVSDIKRYDEYSPDSVAGWSDAMADIDPAYGVPFKNSIIIGGMIEEQELLLVPFEDGTWQCWFLANWVPGENKYPSLRYYMEERLQRLEDGFYE